MNFRPALWLNTTKISTKFKMKMKAKPDETLMPTPS